MFVNVKANIQPIPKCVYTQASQQKTEGLSVICIRLAKVVIVLLQWCAAAIHGFEIYFMVAHRKMQKSRNFHIKLFTMFTAAFPEKLNKTHHDNNRAGKSLGT